MPDRAKGTSRTTNDGAGTQSSTQRKPPRFGQYVLLEKLRSEGEYIQSFRCYQLGLEREVEIRILAIRGGCDSPLAKRFVEELKVLARLDHPSIIPVLDQGVAQGKRYFTTTLRPSKRLSDYLADRGGNLPAGEFLRFAEILADAVALIHSEGKLHRGISSRSVFVDLDETKPYIGECSAMREIREESLTALGLPTLADYVPTPEGLLGLEVTTRTDVYLLCSLFYEMLSGSTPLPADRKKLLALLRKHKPGFVPVAPLPAAVCNDIEGISELVMKGLSPRPEDRYQSAEELGRQLRLLAKRYDVKLFVRKAASETRRMKRPPEKADDETASRTRRTGSVRPGRTAKKVPESESQGLAGIAAKVSDFLGGLSDRVIIGAGLAASIVMFAFVGYSMFDGSGQVRQAHIAPSSAHKAPPSAGKADEDLLSLAAEAKLSPTGDKTFLKRLEAFRQWIVANSAVSSKVCRYTDVMKLRYRYLSMKDKKVFGRLDRLLGRAAAEIDEARSASRRHRP